MIKYHMPSGIYKHRKGLKRPDLSLRNSFNKGNKNSYWKGGKINNGKGYMLIYSPDHPFRTKKGYVFEHRLIMEKHLGRYLTKKEIVHHINDIKDDNRIENLELINNNSEHIKRHKTGSKLSQETKLKLSQIHKKSYIFLHRNKLGRFV